MSSPVNVDLEQLLLPVLIQLMVIIGAARLGAILFGRVGQPQVCGEIAAGLLLGPSLFGGLFPDLFAHVFDPSTGNAISLLSQLGLVLLMFLIGLEFDFGHLRGNSQGAATISASGIVVPFALGVVLAHAIHSAVAPHVPIWHFALFMGTALSITAIPVLGRIMIELNIQRTRIGSITISAAAVDDAVGWVLLAIVTAVVRAEFVPGRFALMIGAAAAYTVFVLLIARPLLRRWVRAAMQKHGGELSLRTLAMLLILVFGSAAITNAIGIFSVFGAFLLGAALYDEEEFREAVRRALGGFVLAFFLPIFFAYTGLRTDIGTITGSALWFICALVLLAAVVGKFGGCAAGARLAGFTATDSAIVGALMNTRGLMELVVVNIGFDLGVIPSSVYFMLVMMAVVTTYMTAPMVRRLAAHSDLARELVASPFAREAPGRT